MRKFGASRRYEMPIIAASSGTRAKRASRSGEIPNFGAWSSTSFMFTTVYSDMAPILPPCYIPKQCRRNCFLDPESHAAPPQQLSTASRLRGFFVSGDNDGQVRPTHDRAQMA